MTHKQATSVAVCVLGMMCGWSHAAAAAGGPAWPTVWTAFGPAPPAAGMETSGHPNRGQLVPGSALSSIPAVLEIGGRSYKGRLVSPDTEGRFDLGALFGGVERGKAVYLLAPLKAEPAATLTVGAGADWWMYWWLDGRPVFGTLDTGNQKNPVTAANHTFDLALAAGEHVLAVAVLSGSSQFLLAASPAGAAGAGYADAMAAGRAARKRCEEYFVMEALAEARAAFESAAGRATHDTEKAAALLGLAEAWQAERRAPDRETVRRLCREVFALTNAGPAQQGDAALLLGDAWRSDGQWERAREAYLRAAAVTSRTDVAPGGYTARMYTHKGYSAVARSHLREGNLPAARAVLDELLAKDWMADQPGLRSDAEALRDTVALAELWKAAPSEPPPAAPPDTLPDIEYVVRRLRRDRPRLFLNKERLAAVRRNGLTPDQQAWLEALKRRVGAYPAPPALDAESLLDPEKGVRYAASSTPRVHDGLWGHYAAHAALAWLLTGERDYRNRAASFLAHAAAVWDLIYTHHRMPDSRVYVKINALSAYDWLYDDLSPAERAAIGRGLLPALRAFYGYWRAARTGTGDIYTDTVLGWYLGLAFLGAEVEGAEDVLCLEWIREGYLRHAGIFGQLEAMGPDGLDLHGAMGYATQNLASEINFLDSYRAAIGESVARYFPKRARFGCYTLWNSIVAPNGRLLEYGWSDSHHESGHADPYHLPYLMRVPDLYAGMGDRIELEELKAVARVQAPRDYGRLLDFGLCTLTPASPLLMTPDELPEDRARAILERLPRARHFPDPIGHTFMNSGWGTNDTYALFVAGRQAFARKHYDENHFTIYKKGFLAMDTGTQIAGDGDAPGGGREHQSNYFMDTIAHNNVLIRMEGESFPGFWGHKAVANNGGMNRNHGARVLAFETDSHYTYIASDATSCYHSNKAAEVVRQFLFVYPDWFVVFDRVESKAPDQKKTWLFHTQYEPVETGDTFRADHWEGRVFVRTLLPRDRASKKIGGPGKEFWADGRNWPPADARQRYRVDAEGNPTPDRNLFGQWRMEISPGTARTRDLFLHLIEVGDKAALTAMTPSTLIEDEQTAGVEFQAGARTVRVVFHKAGPVGGQIRFAEAGKVLADRPLAVTVQRQEGLALEK